MKLTDLLTIIGFIVAAGLGAVGWIFSGVANRRANDANDEAAKSNLIANEAVEKADRANRIAEDANRLSEEANKLVGRSLAEQTEDWHVAWLAEWNQASASVILKNRGRDTALDASVTISGNNIHKVERWPNGVPARTDVVVPLTEVNDQQANHRRESPRSAIGNVRGVGNSMIYVEKPFALELDLAIHWRTGEGFVRGKELKLTIT